MSNDIANCVKANYELTISKMQDVMQCWKSRKATLCGRILTINTLYESLFVYKLSVMENINEEMITKV